MSVSDHVGAVRAAASGAYVRDLGKNEAGFRSHLVTWRGAYYRISWKREPAGAVWNGALRPPSLSIVVVRADENGGELADAPPLGEELLEELRSQGRTFASWVPA
jgi:hypothetical protein